MIELDPDRLRTLMRATVEDVQLPVDLAERVTTRTRERRRRRLPMLTTAGLLVVVAAVTSAVMLNRPTDTVTLTGPASKTTPSSPILPSPTSITISGIPQLTGFLPYSVLASSGSSQVVAFLGDSHGFSQSTWLCTGVLRAGQSLADIQRPNCGGWNSVAAEAESVSGPDPVTGSTGTPTGTSLGVGVVRADVTSAQVLLATPEAIDAAAAPDGGFTTDVIPVDVRVFPAVHTQTGDLRVYTFQYPSQYNFAGLTGRNAAGQLVLNDRTRTYCGPDPKTHENVPCPTH